MDAKAEAQALADSKRHAKEFCKKNNIPDDEWELAVFHSEENRVRLLAEFWKLWEDSND
jgi:phosphoribosylamine-glycine ligase